MKHLLAICTLLLGLFALLYPASAARAQTWHEISSENFIVFTDAEPEFAQGLVKDLEIFRKYLIEATGVDKAYVAAVKDAGAENPFLVYGLKDQASFRRFTSQENISLSFAHPRGMVTYIDFGLHPDPFEGKRGKPGRQQLFYEYTRYFLKQYSAFNYPLWYSRGLAMYLSTFEYQDGKASIGLPHLRTVRILSGAVSHHLLPMHYILGSTREYSHEIMSQGEATPGEVFSQTQIGVNGQGLGQSGSVPNQLSGHSHLEVANTTTSIRLLGYQAWGLVHYLQSTPEYRQKLVDYLIRLDAGEQFEPAFENVFGESMDDMWDKSYAYTKRKLFPSYTVEFPIGATALPVTVRELQVPEAAFVTASGKSFFLGQKKRLFAIKNQLEAAASAAYRVEAKTILAEMELFTDHREKAREIISDVLAGNPDAGRANGVMGAILVEEGSIEEARGFLRKAIKQNENDVLALYYLGLSQLYQPDETLAEGVGVMNRAFMIYPQNEKMRYELAALNVLAEETYSAIPELHTLATWGSTEAIRAQAAACLAKIQQKQVCDITETRMAQNR